MAQIHIQDNFGSGPISQVPASWFNSVAKFINNLIGGDGVTVDKHCDGSPSIIDVEIPEGTMGTPTDNTGSSEGASEPFGLSFTNWTAGGDNGLKVRLYSLVEEDGGEHILQPVDIQIKSNGQIQSVSIPSGNHGIWIGA